MNLTATLVAAYGIGAAGTLAFCVALGLDIKRERVLAATVLLGWPATLIGLGVIAACERLGILHSNPSTMYCGYCGEKVIHYGCAATKKTKGTSK